MSPAVETPPAPPLAEGPSPPPPGARVDPPRTIIGRRDGWRLVDFPELWRYRELFFFLAWRDVKVRYKQTVLGAAWAILQPLATMAAFALFLGPAVGGRSTGIPYPLYVFSGLLPWMFFSGAISAAGQSVVGGQNLVTKVYFPRLIIPVAAVGAPLVDLAIASGLLLALMVGYGVAPGWGLPLAPALILALLATAIGVGALLAALTVAYRDFRHVVPFMVQLWMFATPIIYLQPEALGPRQRAILPLNPAYGLIANFRRALLGEPPDLYSLSISGAVGLALLATGLLYFRRVERDFSDII